MKAVSQHLMEDFYSYLTDGEREAWNFRGVSAQLPLRVSGILASASLGSF